MQLSPHHNTIVLLLGSLLHLVSSTPSPNPMVNLNLSHRPSSSPSLSPPLFHTDSMTLNRRAENIDTTEFDERCFNGTKACQEVDVLVGQCASKAADSKGEVDAVEAYRCLCESKEFVRAANGCGPCLKKDSTYYEKFKALCLVDYDVKIDIKVSSAFSLKSAIGSSKNLYTHICGIALVVVAVSGLGIF